METIITSGSNAIGSSGTVTYSIGQIFYTYIGESVYNVAQGIQHQEIKETLGTPEIIEPKTEIVIFPNPTADFVNVNMKGIEADDNQKRTYQLYDIQGRLLKQNTINQTETQISLNGLSPSIYMLRVNINNKVSKTFKILKK
ncbi:T9SS type A sorting domain-containing protein [Flavobacterium aquicola]|nr:T9SS type A sorting domain-containing protein [Flavobacterium aquicola]